MTDFKMEVGGVYMSKDGKAHKIVKHWENPGSAYAGFDWLTNNGSTYDSEGRFDLEPSGLDFVRRIDTPEEKESDIVAVISDELRDELTAIKDEDLPSAADVRGIMKPEDTRPPIPIRAEMDAAEYWETVARALFNVLDDIDMADDIAKGNEKLYRNLVMRHHRKRFVYAGTDGYVVRFYGEPTGEGTMERVEEE